MATSKNATSKKSVKKSAKKVAAKKVAPKKSAKKAVPVKKVKVVKAAKEPVITVLSEKIKATLMVPTPVFGKKNGQTKQSVMRANTELTVQKLAEIGPTGTNMVSLKKDNSKRIFYTPEENITNQGIKFK